MSGSDHEGGPKAVGTRTGDCDELGHRDGAKRADGSRRDKLRGRVVVGVDGSETARSAASWAASEAQQRGASLTLVHALNLIDRWYPVPVPEPDVQRRKSKARAMIDQEAERLSLSMATWFSGLAIDTASTDGSAAPFLTTLSETAALLVTGTRGHGGFTGTLVGSVSRKLAAHAHCPLVVVPTAPSPGIRNEIVLGVSHKPSEASIRFAFEAAARYSATLAVVHAWWLAAERGENRGSWRPAHRRIRQIQHFGLGAGRKGNQTHIGRIPGGEDPVHDA